jgi:hypothetical protein
MMSYIKERLWLQTLLVFTLFFCLFVLIYFSVTALASGDDHFFHFRFAQGMFSKGVIGSFTDFKTIAFSQMAEGKHFIYYNFLFYIFVMPFTAAYPLYLGIKLFGAAAAALSFALLYFALRKFDVRHPLIYTLAGFALTGAPLIWRFFLARPYTLAPAILFVMIAFLYKRQYLFAMIASLVYLFWHGATFFFAPLAAAAFVIAEAFHESRVDRKKIYAALGGSLLGLVIMYIIAPGFFTYLYQAVIKILKDSVVGDSVKVPEGVEIYPKDFFDFVRSNAFVFSLYIYAVSVEVYRYIGFKRGSIDEGEYAGGLTAQRRCLQTALFLISISFFIGTIAISGRFMDFFTLFSLLYIAVSLDALAGSVKVEGKQAKRAAISGLVVVLIYLFGSNALILQEQLSKGAEPNTFKGAGEWLESHADRSSVIFNVTWNWFPQLYYYYPEGKYVIGLAGSFLYEYDPRLYFIWSSVAKGYLCDAEECRGRKALFEKAWRSEKGKAAWAKSEGDILEAVLLRDFHSRYVVTSKDYDKLNYILDNNIKFRKAWSDRTYMIYEVL